MKVLFIIPYPLNNAPSQRFRFEQYINLLKKNNINPQFQSFLDLKSWENLYQSGNTFGKIMAVIEGYFRRIKILFILKKFDLVFLHREAAPFGPAVFEWIIAKVFKKKIIYDFDDAIWLSDNQRGLFTLIKNAEKVNSVIKWSWRISAGNKYLADHAREFNQQVFLNPTTIDTINLHNKLKDQSTSEIVIGWTGTHSTLKFLDPLIPILTQLHKTKSFKLLVICNSKPDYDYDWVEFVQWDAASEINDLLKMNIGLMPLADDPWSKGKCGFKALQYMALGIPAVVSPVGVNTEIVDHDINGYICMDDADWKKYMTILIDDAALRKEMGRMAREKVERSYSVKSNEENFLNLFLK